MFLFSVHLEDKFIIFAFFVVSLYTTASKLHYPQYIKATSAHPMKLREKNSVKCHLKQESLV